MPKNLSVFADLFQQLCPFRSLLKTLKNRGVVGDEVVRNYLDITIPASVTSIGEGAFTGAGVERDYWNDYTGDYIGSFPSALRSIKVDPANPYYKVENGALMTKDGKMFIALPAASKKLQTPYSGWVKVTATLNHEVYVNGVDNNPVEITDEQYIYVVKPVSKISVAQLTISKGKYKTKEVTSVKAKAGEELNFEQSPYVFAVNYKEYSTYTKDSATFGDISWTSSNTAIATVDQDGNVSISKNAKNKSTVTIKAMAQDGTKVAKSIKITITK